MDGTAIGLGAKRPVRCSRTCSKENIPNSGNWFFVHEFKPAFSEAGLFAHPELLEEVTRINKQIKELAPVLNSPTVADAVTVKSSDEKAPIDISVKRHDGTMYVFAVSMRDAPAKARFEVKGISEKAEAEMIGTDRKIEIGGGKFEDDFGGYEVKLYRIRRGDQDGLNSRKRS